MKAPRKMPAYPARVKRDGESDTMMSVGEILATLPEFAWIAEYRAKQEREIVSAPRHFDSASEAA